MPTCVCVCESVCKWVWKRDKKKNAKGFITRSMDVNLASLRTANHQMLVTRIQIPGKTRRQSHANRLTNHNDKPEKDWLADKQTDTARQEDRQPDTEGGRADREAGGRTDRRTNWNVGWSHYSAAQGTFNNLREILHGYLSLVSSQRESYITGFFRSVFFISYVCVLPRIHKKSSSSSSY